MRLTAALCVFAVASVPLVPGASAYRVLAVEYVPGKSHWNFMRAILHALLDRGHAVTAFTPFPDGGRRENYTEVDLSADVPAKMAMDVTGVLNTFGRTSVMVPLVMQLSRAFCTIVSGKDAMRDILRHGRDGDSGFDVVITETAASECASHVAAELGLPLIYAVPSPMVTYIEPAVLGHVPNPATVSHMMAGHAVPRTFARRFANLVLSAYSAYVLAREETKLRSLDPQPYDLVPPVKPSVVFVNTHHATDAPRLMPPGVVQVGGIHLLDQPKNDLPDVSIQDRVV